MATMTKFMWKPIWLIIAVVLRTLCICSAIKYISGSEYGSHDESVYPRIPSVWPNHGGGNGLENLRWAQFEYEISRNSVKNLETKWTFATEGEVTATPSIADGVVYFPDWKGNLYAVKQHTGDVVWQKTLTEITNLTFRGNPVVSRTTPVVAGKYLLVGLSGPCVLLALDRKTGSLIWSQTLDTMEFARISASPTVYDEHVYIGTSSLEELLVVECCIFQGAFFKLTLESGEILWRVPMMPDNGGKIGGYSGNAIWGSNPPVDVKRRQVYVTTGNNYDVPADVAECELNYQNQTNPPIPDPCLIEDNHVESILAIDIDSGEVVWSRHLGGFDTWLLVCVLPNNAGPNCPTIPGPDYDFGMSPMLLTIPVAQNHSIDNHYSHWGSLKGRDILVVGQKSGIIWAIDRDTGEIVWSIEAGPGGTLGGSSWGMTTDGRRVFTNVINNEAKNFTLAPTSTVTTEGGWVGLNASTGEVLWSKASPAGGWPAGPLSHANGVVFGGVVTEPAGLYALDAETGQELKRFPTHGPIYGGPSIVDGCTYIPIGSTTIVRLAASGANVSIPAGPYSVIAACV